jgi:hypothetical protein
MSEKRVLITVNLKEAEEALAAVLNQLKNAGMKIDHVNEVLGIVHIAGTYSGDTAQLEKKGVSAETPQWSRTQ